MLKNKILITYYKQDADVRQCDLKQQYKQFCNRYILRQSAITQ
jgi:hypothetical protein